ncbi:MAG: hypothetical protein ACYTGH_00250 [Planctomycetota bacterium]
MPDAPKPSKKLVVAAKEAKRAMVRLHRIARAEAGGSSEETLPEDLTLEWTPALSGRSLAETALLEAYRRGGEQAPFQAGQIYCYACKAATCEHARPKAPGEIFTGYGPTGQVRWEEFHAWLLSRGDPRTSLLFSDRGALLSCMVEAEHIRGEQLESFGRFASTYSIWGQVVAGYVPDGIRRLALTVQLVETANGHLYFQLIADPSLREVLADTPAESHSALHRLDHALQAARREVEGLARSWQLVRGRKHRERLQRKGLQILRHLNQSLGRKGRQQDRRTRHAEQRGAENRPVHKALSDLQAAGVQDFLFDRYKRSVIVLGKGGRMHAFSPEGRHITSLFLGGDELERRIIRKRYRPMQEEEVRDFRGKGAERSFTEEEGGEGPAH